MAPWAFVPALPTLSPTALVPPLLPVSRGRTTAVDTGYQWTAFRPFPASSSSPPFPLNQLRPGDARARIYYLARNGIYHGLRALGVGRGDVVLMPSYHHGVEVEAVRHTGAGVVFYRVDDRFQADLEDIERCLVRERRDRPQIRALYLTHIAGFAQPVAEARALCRRYDLLLVEDCALALFSRDPSGRWLGTEGDLSIFCLYKTLPVPHGGVALARAPLCAGVRPPLASTLHHLAGATLAWAALHGGPMARRLREGVRAVTRRTVDRVVEHVHVGTQHLRPEELGLGASLAVEQIVRQTDAAEVVARRRHNFNHLLGALGEDRVVPTGPLPEGTSPLFFPLRVSDRRAALATLWARGVEAIDFWSTGDAACEEGKFPETVDLRRHVIEIPIHQDLDDEDMDLVARVVKQVLAHG